MASIFDQYKAVNKGTLSESQFLRNAKIALPKFISNMTTFKDAVTILKNKGIITEEKSSPMEYGMPNEWCNPQEYDLGMRYELDKGTNEEKADKIVCKNLKDNAAYYSQLHLAGYNEDAMKVDRKKRTDLPTEVKKDNFIDTANSVKKVKMDALTEDELKILVGDVLNEVISFSEFRKIRQQIADLKADKSKDNSKEIADLEAKLPKRDDTVKKVDNSWVANFYDQPSTGRGGKNFKND
jgi:hypothetical protein